MERAYEDKLDGAIDDKFWKMKSAKWNSELIVIGASLESHRRANHSYLQVGGPIIDLAGQAHDLYVKRDNWERRRLLDVVLSECTFEDGNLYATYNKPFSIIAEGTQTQEWRPQYHSPQTFVKFEFSIRATYTMLNRNRWKTVILSVK